MHLTPNPLFFQFLIDVIKVIFLCSDFLILFLIFFLDFYHTKNGTRN